MEFEAEGMALRFASIAPIKITSSAEPKCFKNVRRTKNSDTATTAHKTAKTRMEFVISLCWVYQSILAIGPDNR